MLGVTTKTIRNWDRDGKIKVIRSPSNYRMVSMDEVARLQGVLPSKACKEKTLIYARCSTEKQRENLERQIERLENWCNERDKNYELYYEIGSGLNGSRRQVKKLIKRMSQGDVKELVIEYKDRLTRFGFDYFSEFCEAFGVELICLEEQVSKAFEQEMTDDIIGLITSYSARMYGRRGGQKDKKA